MTPFAVRSQPRGGDRPTDRRQQGFTLVEIMVVVVIIGLLATVVAQNVLGDVDTANLNKVKTDIANIKQAATRYRVNMSQFPESIQALIDPDENDRTYLDIEEVPKDPWGSEYVLEVIDGKLLVSSCGVDKEIGTEDDITSKNMASLKTLPKSR